MKLGKFELTDERRELFRKELEDVLKENSHLTLKNFLHQKSLSKRLWQFVEEKIALAIKEIKTGYKPAPHQEQTDLTPRQRLKHNNVSVQINAGGNGMIAYGKKD